MKFSSIKKPVCLIMIILMAFAGYKDVSAQNEEPDTITEEATANVITNIMESSEGNVEIIIEDELIDKILTPPTAHKRNTPKGGGKQSLKPGLNRISGYRIQVFSDGRNQHSLESRARARGNAISAKFPKYRGQVYTFSSAPNWYTRVGNFRNAAEADDALAELRRSFPAFADEMRIVKCQIVVLK